MIILIILPLVFFLIGLGFGILTTMAHYEKRIQQDSYFTKEEKEDFENEPKSN